MIRFNGSCTEVPTTGEPTTQASFEATVKTSGVFIARIKRSGKRSKQLGWVEIFLLDNEKLAICSDSSTDSDSETSERFLLFPLFEGSTFRQIKRHGHALTLMAPSYSVVLEAEAADDRASTQASKWGRILHRLSTPEQSRSSTYFKGLGISLNTLASKPQRTKGGRKQLVPAQPLNQDVHSNAKSEEEPRPVGTSLMHITEPPTNQMSRSAVPPRTSIYSSSYKSTGHQSTGFQSTNVPRSTSDKSLKAAKRLSLGLAKPGTFSFDLGFGDDLKGILGALEPGGALDGELEGTLKQDSDQAEEEQEPRIKEVSETSRELEKESDVEAPTNTDSSGVKTVVDTQSHQKKSDNHDNLAAPLKPFADTGSLTPSPNSLYLQNASPSDSSLLSSSSNKELNRMESILVKEQQQQLDRYGNRAAAMSSFDLNFPAKQTAVSASSSSLPSNEPTATSSALNPPPGIPPPVPNDHPVRVGKRVSIAQTSPAVQYIPRDDSGAESESDTENEKGNTGGLPSPEPERPQPVQQTNTSRKKNPGIVKAVKKLWNKRRFPKEQQREFKGPMELLREQEEAQRQLYEISRPATPPLDDDTETAVQEQSTDTYRDDTGRDETIPKSRSTAAGEWRALAMVEEESENERTPKLPPSEDDSLQVAQAVAPAEPNHATSAVPKLNSQSSISALSFRSMRSQGSLSSGLSSDDTLKHLHLKQDQMNQQQPKLETLKSETPASEQVKPEYQSKPEISKTVARLDPKQDASWQDIVSQHTKTSSALTAKAEPELAAKPTPKQPAPMNTHPRPTSVAVPTTSLDPGRFTVPDRTTNPIIRKVFESGNNKSTPTLAKVDGQHSASSSYSSFGSFKRSTSSYGSQASSLSSMSYSNSASSISAPNLVSPQKPSNALEVTLLTTNLWVSKWGGTKWTPLSQLELRTDVVATSAGVRLLVMNPGGVGCIPIRFSPQCELRRVSAHDTELKTPDNTYMFRGRDAENSQKFYRTLSTLQTEGVGSSGVSLPNVSSLGQSHDDTFDSRRRTLMPPALSRNSYVPKYMGMSTSTIVEE